MVSVCPPDWGLRVSTPISFSNFLPPEQPWLMMKGEGLPGRVAKYTHLGFWPQLLENIDTHTTQDETIFNPSAKPSSISKSSKLTYMGFGSCSLTHVQELAGLACTNCTNCTGKRRRRRSRSSETMEIFNTWSLKPPLTDLYAEKHHALSTTQLNTSLQL